jgi:predicted transposase YbfD/YdcC
MRLVLGQVKTDEKSSEINAMPQFIDLLELEGCIVTIDVLRSKDSDPTIV